MNPVAFTINRDDHEVIEARLGERLVGVIERYPFGEAVCLYRVFMPTDGAVSGWRSALSVTAARRQLLQWLAGWFESAGPHFAYMVEAIGAQALAETEGVEV